MMNIHFINMLWNILQNDYHAFFILNIKLLIIIDKKMHIKTEQVKRMKFNWFKGGNCTYQELIESNKNFSISKA